MSGKNTNGRTVKQRSSSVDRRLFIQGMGMTAAAAFGAVTHNKAVAADSKATSTDPGSGILRQSPVVMIWRRISSLHEVQSFVSKILGLPVIGQDPISIMYDAGGVLLGYSLFEVPASGDAVSEACSDMGLQDYSLQNNPASALVFAPFDFQDSVQKLHTTRGMVTAPSRSEAGEKLIFLDNDGNFSCFYRPSNVALNGEGGVKLRTLLKNRAGEAINVSFDEGSQARQKVSNPVVGIELLVSDLSKAKRFYTEVLGLQPLPAAADEAKFDIGSLVLTLRLEPTNMLVQFLKKTGRLVGDWFVFHVSDIKETTRKLVQQGVKFPSGIETSVIGDVAYFNDPDGYSLVLWQPSGKIKMINFTPVLKRLLEETRKPSA